MGIAGAGMSGHARIHVQTQTDAHEISQLLGRIWMMSGGTGHGGAGTDKTEDSSASEGGTQTKGTSNLGNEIDITPSANHTTTTKNPGLEGTPNSSIDIVDSAGNIKTRRWFDSDGMQMRDVDFTNHGNAKLHPEWPHEHGTR